MNPYQKLMARKRKWTPVKPVAGQCREGAEEVILRALALRHMELPVGDFIKDGLDREVPEAARELLQSNVTDEENHDLALGYIAEAYGLILAPKLKHSNFGTRGLLIRITRSRKRWLPSVQFSSFSYPCSVLTVMLECVHVPLTSAEMSRFTSLLTRSYAKNSTSLGHRRWISLGKLP